MPASLANFVIVNDAAQANYAVNGVRFIKINQVVFNTYGASYCTEIYILIL